MSIEGALLAIREYVGKEVLGAISGSIDLEKPSRDLYVRRYWFLRISRSRIKVMENRRGRPRLFSGQGGASNSSLSMKKVILPLFTRLLLYSFQVRLRIRSSLGCVVYTKGASSF